MRSLFLAIAIIPLAVGTASADFVGNGPGFSIPDDDPLGITSDINVSLGTNEVITDVEVTLLGMSHTWIGDVTATVTGPGGSIDIMFRVGDDQGDCCGDSSNFGGDYTFVDGGASLWAAALGAGNGDVIAPGSYAPTTATGTVTSFATTYGGAFTNGTWTLFMSDSSGGDTGAITGWRLTIFSEPPPAIPEPASLGLIGLASLGMVCYRRRR